MTASQIACRRIKKCDICGGPMFAVPGGGWDYDRIVCFYQQSCSAEIVFPTSTPPSDEPKKKEPKK